MDYYSFTPRNTLLFLFAYREGLIAFQAFPDAETTIVIRVSRVGDEMQSIRFKNNSTKTHKLNKKNQFPFLLLHYISNCTFLHVSSVTLDRLLRHLAE